MAGGNAVVLAVGGLLHGAGGAETVANEGELLDAVLALKMLAGAFDASRDLLEAGGGAKPLAELVHVGRRKLILRPSVGAEDVRGGDGEALASKEIADALVLPGGHATKDVLDLNDAARGAVAVVDVYIVTFCCLLKRASSSVSVGAGCGLACARTGA